MNYFAILLLSLINSAVLLVVYKRVKNKLIMIAPVFWFLIANYTWVGLPSGISKEIPFRFLSISSVESINVAILYFMICSISISVGVVFSSLYRPAKKINFLSMSSLKWSESIFSVKNSYKLMVSISWILLYVLSYGPLNLIFRETYRPGFYWEDGLKLSMILLPISSVAVGLINKLAARYFFTAMFFLVIIGTSSRMIAIFLLFLFAGCCIREKRINPIHVILTAVLILWLSSFMVYVRNMPVQGIIYNLFYLISGLGIKEIILSINYLTSFSIGVLAYSIDIPYMLESTNALSYSLNPFPSFLLTPPSYSVSLFGTAPYSAFSILINEGYWLGPLYFMTSGLIFGLLFSFFYGRSALFWGVSCVLYTLFTFYSTQYYLRDATRFIYYAIFIFVFYLSYVALKRISRNLPE